MADDTGVRREGRLEEACRLADRVPGKVSVFRAECGGLVAGSQLLQVTVFLDLLR